MLAEQVLREAIADITKHLPGRHDQKQHGRGGEFREYNPNPPTLVMYHGTQSNVVASILKEGFLPPSDLGTDKKVWKESGGSKKRRESVYVATEYGDAHDYASAAASKFTEDNPKKSVALTIFEVEVPKEKLERDEVDRSARRVRGRIPPEWIVGYTLLYRDKDGGIKNTVKYFRVKKSEGFDIVYVPIISIDEEVAKHLAGRHNQKEHGRLKSKPQSVRIDKNGNVHSLTGPLKGIIDKAIRITGVTTDAVSGFEVVTPASMNASVGFGGLGYYRPGSREIAVIPNSDRKRQLITLVHEIGHAMDFAYPTLAKQYFDWASKNAPEEIKEIKDVLRRTYRNRQEAVDNRVVRQESFAEVYALAMIGKGSMIGSWVAGRYDDRFPKTVKYFKGRGP